MSREIFSCPHTKELLPGTIEIKWINPDGYHTTHIMNVCENCLIWYRKNALVIDNEVQRERWVNFNIQSNVQ